MPFLQDPQDLDVAQDCCYPYQQKSGKRSSQAHPYSMPWGTTLSGMENDQGGKNKSQSKACQYNTKGAN